MLSTTFNTRRNELETYFDRTAVDAWARLTSDAPVGRIRATVRAGRDSMRDTLLSWLPQDLTGSRILDAGCGTGALSVAAAGRGAEVLAIDISPTLIGLARERTPAVPGTGKIDFQVGDMLDPALGHFDYVVAMDSLIHYRAKDVMLAVSQLAPRTANAVLMTFAPRTPFLALAHAVGRALPSGHRAPAIETVAEGAIWRLLGENPDLREWVPGRTKRVASGFYTSQALELVRS